MGRATISSICKVVFVLACAIALSQCLVLQPRPNGSPARSVPDRGPRYAKGSVIVVGGVLRSDGRVFVLDDDSSDANFRFVGVKRGEADMLERVLGRHVQIRLRVISVDSPRSIIADFIELAH